MSTPRSPLPPSVVMSHTKTLIKVLAEFNAARTKWGAQEANIEALATNALRAGVEKKVLSDVFNFTAAGIPFDFLDLDELTRPAEHDTEPRALAPSTVDRHTCALIDAFARQKYWEVTTRALNETFRALVNNALDAGISVNLLLDILESDSSQRFSSFKYEEFPRVKDAYDRRVEFRKLRSVRQA